MGLHAERARAALQFLAFAVLGLTAAAATARAQQPDFSGIWLSSSGQETAHAEPSSLFEPRGTGGPGGEPQLREPYRAEYQALEARVGAREESGKPLFDSETQCRPDGMPKMMRAFLPIQIVQTPSQMLVVAEELMQIRRIYLNERLPPLDELEPSYNGYSVGRWEGSTLVVETIGVRTDARFLDMPHSEQMKVTERFTLAAADVLEDHVVIEDPQVLARPYVFTWRYKKEKGYKITEYVCDNNRYRADGEGNSVIQFDPPATAPSVQAAGAEAKPPMYSYQTIWTLPRTQWVGMEKVGARNRKILDRAVANGELIAYGNDSNLMHTADGWTHANWWAATSMAGVFNVLDEIGKSGATESPVLAAATKQVDGLYISRHYNWRPGAYQGLYTHIEIYRLKADATRGAVDTLSNAIMAPLLETLLADGTIVEYEIDEEAFPTGAPQAFFLNYMVESPGSLEKVHAALAGAFQAHPLTGTASTSPIDFTAYRDSFSRTNNAVFK